MRHSSRVWRAVFVALVVALVVALFVADSVTQRAALAQSAPAAAGGVPHTVEPGTDSLTLSWQTSTPARGWVLYGAAPGELNAIAVEAAGESTSHRVVIGGLQPGSLVYYLIAGDGPPAGKGGRPYSARTNDAPAADAVAAAQAQVVHVAELGLSLVTPAGWRGGALADDVVDGLIYGMEGAQGSLTITRQPNAQGLSPQGWFARTRADYHPTLAREVGSTLIGGSPALIVGQPESCQTQAMLVALAAHEGFLYTFTWFENAGRAAAPEAAQILGSVRFDGDASAGAAALDGALAVFPAATEQPECGSAYSPAQPAEVAAIPPTSKCAGAAMYLPGPGPDLQPWSCFSYDPICGPYNPTSVWGSYFKLPHRGIDLGGQTGVTPVYATFSGTAYKYNVSNIRISFDGLYTGKSVWLAHMASQDGTIDYRRITNGQKVTAGQFIGYSGYYNTSGDPPHLHISYVNNSTGTESWPSLDPTKFLSAKNMVWYEGWNYQTPLECSAPTADVYEPDNFTNLAPLVSVSTGDQRHDFHAAGDEDYVRFAAVAGQTYYIHTLGLDAGNDTTLALLSTNGTTVLAENDDHYPGTLASRIQWKAATSGTYYVRVRHFSFSGYEPYRPQVSYTTPVYGPNTGYTLRIRLITPNILVNRPALSTTYDYAQGLKAPFGNDGNMQTRYSSAIGAASPQWWWVDTASVPFDRVIIRWETAYAGKYFIGWSNDNVTYTGYNYVISHPGAFAHSLAALRTAKYLGIRMEQTAPLMNNYSFYEAEAMRAAPGAAAAGVEEEPLIELAPSGELITLVRAGPGAEYSIYLPGVAR